MAKLIKTYENGEIKTELTFNGETYTLTMMPYEDGVSRSKEKDFSHQIREKTKNNELVDEIEESLDMLDYDDDDDIQTALDELGMYED